MESWSDRINLRINELGISKAQFARALDISDQRLRHYLTGRNEPNFELISKIVAELGVTADWLILGNRNSSIISGQSNMASSLNLKMAKLTESQKKDIETTIHIMTLANVSN